MNPSPAKQGARRDNYYSSFAQTSQDPEEEADIFGIASLHSMTVTEWVLFYDDVPSLKLWQAVKQWVPDVNS